MVICSCSSDAIDEPEQDYRGPWCIVYSEMFYGIHNNNAEVKEWYNDNKSIISWSQFLTYDPIEWVYPTKTEAYEYCDDEISMCGAIEWYTEIDYAKESDLKKSVSQFESFSIPKNENGYYDEFKAEYAPISNNTDD